MELAVVRAREEVVAVAAHGALELVKDAVALVQVAQARAQVLVDLCVDHSRVSSAMDLKNRQAGRTLIVWTGRESMLTSQILSVRKSRAMM